MKKASLSIRSAAILAAILFPAPSRAEVAQDSRALVVELLELSGGSRMFEQVIQVMLVSAQQSSSTMVEDYISSQPDLSEDERATLRQEIAESGRLSARLAWEIPRRLRFEEFVDKVYVPLYEKYFTPDELYEIVEFHRTPTGRKLTELAPAMVQESMEAATPVMQPLFMDLVEEILEEEQARALGSNPSP